jgi:hypothetical protein
MAGTTTTAPLVSELKPSANLRVTVVAVALASDIYLVKRCNQIEVSNSIFVPLWRIPQSTSLQRMQRLSNILSEHISNATSLHGVL